MQYDMMSMKFETKISKKIILLNIHTDAYTMMKWHVYSLTF